MKTYMTVHVIAMKDGKFLLLQRAKHRTNPGTWNVVTGHVREKESAEDAALRELKEETNLEGKLVKTGEPFWVDQGDIRWIVVPSLINTDDISHLRWMRVNRKASSGLGLMTK